MVNFAEKFLGIKSIEYKSNLSTVEVRNRLWNLDQQEQRLKPFQYDFTRVQIPDMDMTHYRVKLIVLRRHRWFTLTLVYLDGLVSTGGDRKTFFTGKMKYGESYYFSLFGALLIGFMIASGGLDLAFPIFGIIFAAVLLLFVMSLAHQQKGDLMAKVRSAIAPLAA